jgi:hypothetical protein
MSPDTASSSSFVLDPCINSALKLNMFFIHVDTRGRSAKHASCIVSLHKALVIMTGLVYKCSTGSVSSAELKIASDLRQPCMGQFTNGAMQADVFHAI